MLKVAIAWMMWRGMSFGGHCRWRTKSNSSNHERLASYLNKRQTGSPPDSPAPEKYENPDWCQYTAEFLYHGLFARKDDGQRQFSLICLHLAISKKLKW
jgi:hypothetical protein